jgi:capsular exopolysaccharide synthesis family protein
MKYKDVEVKRIANTDDFSRIIHYLIQHWKLLLFSGLMGLLLAFIYNNTRIHRYAVSTSILIPGNDQITDTKDLFTAITANKSNNIYDQIGIIKSFYTINQTLNNMDWKTRIYQKNMLIWRDLYKKEPFMILEPENDKNPKGIRIYITPVSESTYKISGKGTLTNHYSKERINFEGTGEFGKLFQNKYCNFILSKEPGHELKRGTQYYFIFNDLNQSTVNYYKKLEVELRDKKSNILECRIKGENPTREGDFINELIRVYIKGKMDQQNEAQLRSLEFINNQLSGISDSLNNAGQRFSNFRSQNNIIDLGAEGNLIMNKLKDLETERAQSQVQLNYFRDLLSYLKTNADLNKVVSPSVVGIQDASLNALVLKMGELYNRRQIMSFSAKENNITIKLIDKELAQIRDQLNENLKNLIINASKSVNSINQRISLLSSNLNRLPQKEQQMVTIQRQFNLTNEIYTFLLQKRAETNIALASRIPDVQIIDTAKPEVAIPVGLSDKVTLVLGFFLGLIIPLGYKELSSIFDITIQTQQDIENYTDIPITGNILHDSSNSKLVMHENPHSLTTESFRSLRTNLQLMINGTDSGIISLHSLNPYEGKTFVSKNLAVAFALNQKKVLLIGADMRKPKLHKIFNVSNDRGLSTYLSGKHRLDEIIFPTQIKYLWFLPSGPVSPNPSELLSRLDFKNLLNTLSNDYDYIIIDTPPVGLVADGILISQLCDMNLFILRYGFSHKHEPLILDQYASSGRINHMGIIVNDIKSNAFGSTYYKNFYFESYQRKYHNVNHQEVGNPVNS